MKTKSFMLLGCKVLRSILIGGLLWGGWVSLFSAPSGSAPEPDPFTPHASAAEYARPPYGLNKDGVLYFDYGERYNRLGKYENPTFVASYANALYRDYLISGEDSIKRSFLDQVDFLIRSASIDERGACWPYPFENPHYEAPAGWYSGMTSGRILGVLARAHFISGDSKYIEFAEKVFDRLSRPLADGGMTTYLDYGVWLEEVAHFNVAGHGVLNGHIYALSGLLAYANYANNNKAMAHAKLAIEAVRHERSDLDSGFLSYYSRSYPSGRLRPFAERRGYNVTHVSQMLWLYDITKDAEFLNLAMRFQFFDNFNPVVNASFTTNPVTNGPERMNLTFGTNYWSSYRFPVEIVMTFADELAIKGVVILGHTPASTPEGYVIETWTDGDWHELARDESNTELRNRVDFPVVVNASKLKLTVSSAVGKRAVALDGIGVLAQEPRAMIADFKNYTADFYKLSDGDHTSAIVVNDAGFIIIPANAEHASLVIHGAVGALGVSRLYGSSDLVDWKLIDAAIARSEDTIEYRFASRFEKFYKLEFGADFVARMSEVVLR